MRIGFMTGAEDVQWLKDTALKGVTLPTKWAGFQSFALQGNEDCPHAVNLYASADPNHDDDYFRVRFDSDGLTYCTCLEWNGKTCRPYGGLAPNY